MMLNGGLLGVVIGTVLGLTGAGGGIFAVPALLFGLGMDIRAAAPVALLAVGAAASLGAFQGLRQGLVRYKAACMLAAAGTVTAPLGVHLAHTIPTRWLNLLFVAVMFVVAYRMFMSARNAQTDGELATIRAGVCRISKETGRFIWGLKTVATMVGIGAVSGIFTGMLGVGGGFIIVPALAYFTELRMHSIVATSLMVIALLSVITVFAASRHGLAMGPETWTFVATALAGMAGARLLAPKVSPAALQKVFSIACVVIAVMMLLRNLAPQHALS